MLQYAQFSVVELQKTISNLNAYIDILRQTQSVRGPTGQGAAKTKAIAAQLEQFSALVSTKASAFQTQVKSATDTLNAKVDCLEKMYGLPSTKKPVPA